MEIKNRQKRKERKRRVAILMLMIVASVISLLCGKINRIRHRKRQRKWKKRRTSLRKISPIKKIHLTGRSWQQPAARRLCWILQSAIRRPSILSKAILIMTALLLTETFPQRFSRARFRCSCNGTSVGDYEQYGDSFMAVTGCGPTCLSMVYSGLTGKTDMNPYEVAKRADAEGYYVNGEGSLWTIMETFAGELGLHSEPSCWMKIR